MSSLLSLKAEIAAKRKATGPPASASGSGSSNSAPSAAAAEPPAKKWVRRADILAREREEYERQEEEARRKRLEKEQAKSRATASAGKGKTDEDGAKAVGQPGNSAPVSSDPAGAQLASAAVQDAAKETFNISPEDCARRLRARGEPIRLFGESDKERRLRLRALELIEERGGGGRVGQNDFRKALLGAESSEAKATLERLHAQGDKGSSEVAKDKAQQLEQADAERLAKEKEGGKAEGGRRREGVGMDQVLDLELVSKDKARVFPMIYYTLRGLLQDWEDFLAARPDDVRRSTQGKLAAATQVQSAEYLRPLFKQLRHRDLPDDMLLRIAEIVHYMQKREYRTANDSYLQMSIGNAPWPIGATSVGIHERSGREKIFSSKIAHVLNDEETRKYIQSLKRLMTFAQTRYPPADVSMLMG